MTWDNYTRFRCQPPYTVYVKWRWWQRRQPLFMTDSLEYAMDMAHTIRHYLNPALRPWGVYVHDGDGTIP